ncbi:hypothetical protein NQ317_008918 [Molorchus minor]|uniref:Uncharacterized protein n=1 Tax=Molorchus minor TaxID=1323400 RepID=A0ABQ9JTH8_9CUCU|nr:hypothetical protein NQ317_008918 [Molorchus minor]
MRKYSDVLNVKLINLSTANLEIDVAKFVRALQGLFFLLQFEYSSSAPGGGRALYKTGPRKVLIYIVSKEDFEHTTVLNPKFWLLYIILQMGFKIIEKSHIKTVRTTGRRPINSCNLYDFIA